MATPIQVEEKTRQELLKYASELGAETGRRVTFDDAVRHLLEEVRGVRDARAKFQALFGSLRDQGRVWEELHALRRAERTALEKRAKAT